MKGVLINILSAGCMLLSTSSLWAQESLPGSAGPGSVDVVTIPIRLAASAPASAPGTSASIEPAPASAPATPPWGPSSSDWTPASTAAPSSAPASAPTTSQSTSAASAPAGVDLGGYEELIRVCKLSDAQRAQLAQQVWQMQQDMGDFWKSKQDTLAQLRKETAAAQEAGDTLKVRDLQDQFTKLIMEGYKPIRSKHYKAIMAILTPQQRLLWEGSSVDRVLRPYARLDLSDEQKQKLQQVREESAKELAAVDDSSDLARQYPIFRKALWRVYDDILTDQQREQAPSPPTLGRMLMTPSTTTAPASTSATEPS